MLFGAFCADLSPAIWLGGRVRICKCRGITNVLIFEPPDHPFLGLGFFIVGEYLLYRTRFLGFVISVLLCTGTSVASTCSGSTKPLDYEKHIDTTYHTFAESTFMAAESGLCKIGGYTLIEIPDDLVPIYNGCVMGSVVNLCDNGYIPNNGSCVPYTTGACNTNDDDLALAGSTFMAVQDDLC